MTTALPSGIRLSDHRVAGGIPTSGSSPHAPGHQWSETEFERREIV
jgi:hypothetical protein